MGRPRIPRGGGCSCSAHHDYVRDVGRLLFLLDEAVDAEVMRLTQCTAIAGHEEPKP